MAEGARRFEWDDEIRFTPDDKIIPEAADFEVAVRACPGRDDDDAVAAQRYRLAQANALLRWYHRQQTRER